MLLRAKDAEKYPEFRDYLYYRFPTVIDSSKITAGAKTYGKLDRGKFQSALHPGAYPLISIFDLDAVEPGTYKSCSLGGVSNDKITLASPLIATFDKDPWGDQNYFKNSRGKDVPVIGAVLLHFLCHWGNRDAFSINDSSGAKDVGYQFEDAVYGKRASFRITSSTVLA